MPLSALKVIFSQNNLGKEEKNKELKEEVKVKEVNADKGVNQEKEDKVEKVVTVLEEKTENNVEVKEEEEEEMIEIVVYTLSISYNKS